MSLAAPQGAPATEVVAPKKIEIPIQEEQQSAPAEPVESKKEEQAEEEAEAEEGGMEEDGEGEGGDKDLSEKQIQKNLKRQKFYRDVDNEDFF